MSGYYLVCSKPWTKGRVIFGDNPDPGEPHADVWEGEAMNAQEARWKAYQSGNMEDAIDQNLGDSLHPLHGWSVERLDLLPDFPGIGE
jgi:hypothetical protein